VIVLVQDQLLGLAIWTWIWILDVIWIDEIERAVQDIRQLASLESCFRVRLDRLAS
jgi:hypothetical protein